jgi:hypothetical protein
MRLADFIGNPNNFGLLSFVKERNTSGSIAVLSVSFQAAVKID